MYIFVALVALASVAWATPSSHPEHQLQALFQAKFRTFKAQHGKAYAPHEEPKRLQNFLKTTHRIEAHNERFAKGLETFTMGHNDMSDMSFDEFKRTRMGEMPDTTERQNVTTFMSPPQWTRPASIDWRTWGYVNPKVKDQGQCGSCYSFAAIGVLESLYFRKYNYMFSLSEQNIVDCSVPDNYGCNGGFRKNAFEYVQKSRGVNTEDSYPYQEKLGQCRFNSRAAYAPVASSVILPAHDEEALANAVATVGPIAVAYDAATTEFMSYESGIYYSDRCRPDNCVHAVVLVGYGSENGVDYWTCKNSWGAKWGEKGYFRMRRNIRNKCGIATAAVYAVLS